MAEGTVTRDRTNGDVGPRRVLDALERIAVGMVGITASVFAADPSVDLTLLQWRTLVVITEANDGLRISEIASRVGASLPSASRLVDRLEKRGLVTVATDAADRRARIVRSSRTGSALRRRLVARRRELLAARVGGRELPTDLVPGLEAIGRALDSER